MFEVWCILVLLADVAVVLYFVRINFDEWKSLGGWGLLLGKHSSLQKDTFCTEAKIRVRNPWFEILSMESRSVLTEL